MTTTTITATTRNTKTATTNPKTAAPVLWLDYADTPVGPFAVIADAEGRLHAAGWHDADTNGRLARQLGAYGDDVRAVLRRASDPGGLTTAMRAYFAGDLGAIAALPIAEAVGTLFQRTVWQALRAIPCGQTRSYLDIARQIGRPAAVRAVGMANGANPIGVVVPCHRVIGSSGALVGYGGGIERKRWLLAHERPSAPQ